MAKRNFCVVVPSFNEARVIASSLVSIKKIVKSADIYVVSDGSTDDTVSIARKAGVNIMALRKNRGKAGAQEIVIKAKLLTKRYKYILFADADSCFDKNFIKEIKKYISQSPALVVGTVTSDKRGFISAFRTYEYSLSHRIYKNAQNTMRTITVAPGCAALYRSDVLEKLDLDNNTLTEDFDLTIQIHQKKLGKVIYASKALVVTQDPMTLSDYWKQVLRWNTGTWQNVFCHQLYKPNSMLNFELFFLFLDNFLWLFTVGIIFLYPIIALRSLEVLIVSTVALGTVVAGIEKKYWIIPFVPFFGIFYVINIAAYYYSFFRAFKYRRGLNWQKLERYSV